MSYSFNAKGATKAAALEAVKAELDKVVASQPVHAADRPQAEAHAAAMVGVIPEPGPEQEVVMSVRGWVSWEGVYPDSHRITSASCQASASLAVKQPA